MPTVLPPFGGITVCDVKGSPSGRLPDTASRQGLAWPAQGAAARLGHSPEHARSCDLPQRRPRYRRRTYWQRYWQRCWQRLPVPLPVVPFRPGTPAPVERCGFAAVLPSPRLWRFVPDHPPPTFCGWTDGGQEAGSTAKKREAGAGVQRVRNGIERSDSGMRVEEREREREREKKN